MTSQNLKRLLAAAAILVLAFVAVEKSFAQCGTHFKTGYRKILDSGNYSRYELEDWNNDGKIDFWKFQYNQNTDSQDIYVYLNNGSGDWNWSNPQIYPTAIPAFHFNGYDLYYLLDFEGDGDKDIFSVRQSSFHTIHRNNGNGTFTASATQLFEDGQVISTIGFVDVNSDNRLDWIQVANRPGTGNPYALRLANADGTYGALTIIFNPISQSSFARLGDFNGDGKTDLIYYDYVSPYQMALNNGSGGFTPAGSIVLPPSTSLTSLVKDFNNDGKSDILAVRAASESMPRTFYIFYGQANGTLNAVAGPVGTLPAGAMAGGIETADFNGDAKPDFIEYSDYSTSGLSAPPFYSIYLNDGAGGFTRSDYQRPLGPYLGFEFADLNGDAKADIYIKNGMGYSGNVFGEQVISIKYNQCQSFGETKKLNFNGNAKDDFVLWNPNTGDWRAKDEVWWEDGEFSYRTFNWGLGSLGDTPAPGDFDGDGKTDYAVYRSGEGNWYIRQSSNGAWLVVRFGLAGDVAVPNDFDGGGRTDIAVFRPSDGNWYILSSETQQFTAMHFGANGDKAVPQDYDGDGKTDVAVYRPSEGNWYYFKSSDQNYAVFHWGIASDTPVPADYDGDGKADLAVWRGGANGYFIILRSYNNAYSYFPLGKTGDIPFAFYDGGEIATPLVYRSSEWKWFKYEFFSPLYPSEKFFGGNQFAPVYFGLPNN